MNLSMICWIYDLVQIVATIVFSAIVANASKSWNGSFVLLEADGYSSIYGSGYA